MGIFTYYYIFISFLHLAYFSTVGIVSTDARVNPATYHCLFPEGVFLAYVKLGLFNLTILGEVYKPGLYQVYQSDINIFQAIALAGNATDYANKSNVKIVHQTPNGSKVTKVNLNDADILSSPEFYLKPNDIIYIEPLKMKQYGFTSIPYGTIISAISLLVTCFTFVAVYLK